MSALVPKSGDAGRGSGRYPDTYWGYESHPDVTWDTLAMFVASDDPLDRVAAHLFVRNATVLLPELWVVIEDPETSPNLMRDGMPSTRTLDYQIRACWSSHVDEADAQAWCEMFQAKSDALVDRHPWWGESARRSFKVLRAEGAAAYSLRQPGATPRTGAFE